MDLQELFFGNKKGHDFCQGCSILGMHKPFHAVIDDVVKANALFLTESYINAFGSPFPITADSREVLERLINKAIPGVSYEISPSVKCPHVSEKDMKKEDMELCRKHLHNTIKQVDPKIIYCLGNLAFKMVTKKSGIGTKHGKIYEVEIDGKKYPVVPLFHYYSIFSEPKTHRDFIQDIKIPYLYYILEQYKDVVYEYNLVTDLLDLEAYNLLKDTDKFTISFDLETTGLDFKKDRITTIAFSYRDYNQNIISFVIPIDHKDFSWGEDRDKVIQWIKEVLENPKSKKAAHNAKFDMKFLHGIGIFPENVYCTQVMHHSIIEDVENNLKSLKRRYFPDERVKDVNS